MNCQKKDRYKMAFIQFMPHTVPAAWSKGIEDVNNGLRILNVSTDLQLVAKGVIIVVAIALDNFLYRWSES